MKIQYYFIFRGSVLNQALKPASQNGRQTPLINQKPLGDGQGGSGGQGAGDWSKVLDANRAGAAMDADAFTKEKMEKGFLLFLLLNKL